MSWEKVKLGAITKNLDSRRKPLNQQEREKISVKGLYPYIGANNIMGYVDEYLFDEEILCIAEDGGSWGENQICCVLYNQKCWVNNHAHVITGNTNTDLRYLKYYLNKADLSKYITGSTRGKLTKSALESIEIPLPPLHIQQQIANVLDKADALKQKDQLLLHKYDELAQSIFYDMFGDPVKNEKGWEVKKLKDITTKILSGNTPKGGSNVYLKNGITFFRSQNVWKNNLVYDDIAFIDEKTHKSMNKSSLKHKDILMTKTGRINTENSSLGRAALFLGADDSANVNGHVYLIRLLKNQVHEFVLKILTSIEYRNLIREVCVGGIDKRQLNKEHIEDFPIIFPPIDEQRKYAQIETLLNQQREYCEKSLINSENIFNSLIQKIFKEELLN